MTEDLSLPTIVTSGPRARWRFGEADIELTFAAIIDHWRADAGSDAIAFLCREDAGVAFISVHRTDGSLLHRFVQPKDVYFNCLGSNRGHALAVMAKANLGGWTDLWYAVDLIGNQLVSLGEGR